MQNPDLSASQIITFIPGGTAYAKAIAFYKEIGFKADHEGHDFSILRKDNCRFFLQNYPNEWMQGHFMMILEVGNLDDWWTMLSSLGLEEKYPGVKLMSPILQPWGIREVNMVDPCGVLWHISQKNQ